MKFGIKLLEHLIFVKLLFVKIEDHFLSIVEDGVEMPSTEGHDLHGNLVYSSAVQTATCLAEKSNSFHACRESVRKLEVLNFRLGWNLLRFLNCRLFTGSGA